MSVVARGRLAARYVGFSGGDRLLSLRRLPLESALRPHFASWRLVIRCSSSGSGPLALQGGTVRYFAPRIAVFAATSVAAVAIYELVSNALGSEPSGADDAIDSWDEWNEAWDMDLDASAFDQGDVMGASLATAARLRTIPESSSCRRVILVRHAQPPVTASSSSCSTSVALSAEGLRQASLTGERVRALLAGTDVCAIYHSSALEAKATAELLQKALKHGSIIESTLLAEGLPVVPSPAPVGFIASLDDDALLADGARIEGAFRTHVWRPKGNDSDRVCGEVVVTHGNVIRYLVCRALQLPPSAWSRLKAHHCAITCIDIRCDGSVSLLEFGSTGHLPASLVTYH